MKLLLTAMPSLRGIIMSAYQHACSYPSSFLQQNLGSALPVMIHTNEKNGIDFVRIKFHANENIG
jgi:hypothetical protein